MKMLSRLVVVCAIAVGALSYATPSLAAITSSSIASPSDGTKLFYDDLHPTTLAISGTAAGSGNVDIDCYRGGGRAALGGSAVNVPVSGGTFSVAHAPLDNIDGDTCRLRAVPAGTSPS